MRHNPSVDGVNSEAAQLPYNLGQKYSTLDNWVRPGLAISKPTDLLG